MARPWRDIITDRQMGKLIDMKRGTSAQQTKRRFFNRFRKGVKGSKNVQEGFGVLRSLLREYHAIPKTELDKFPLRIRKLRELCDEIDVWFKRFRVDMNKAKQRGMSSHYKRQSLDRTLLTIRNRGCRKASYLEKLRDYYAGNGHSGPRSARRLLQYLQAPHEVNDGSLGLHPSVRMEMLDPWHRDGYEKNHKGEYEEGSIGEAFGEWASDSANLSTPFFLWLEDHAICKCQNDDAKGVVSITYVRADEGDGNDKYKLRIVVPESSGRLYAHDLKNYDASRVVCDTTSIGYRGGDQKAVAKNWGKGTAAFVWTRAKELFIADHLPGGFHHSSFVSGNAVRCAGMIEIDNGKVTGLSNNTGHYKARKQHVKTLLEWLHANHCLDQNCQVIVLGAQGGAFSGTAAQFMFSYATL